jgi:hypothetical protein
MRLALICLECSRREFGDPTWRCPLHRGKTAIQKNRPYFGNPLPQPKINGLQVVDPARPKLKR